MTVLDEYLRLEAEAVWRPSEDAQRQDVVVSIGEATLTLGTLSGQALTHWSLPAIRRVNPGAHPAVFTPDAEGTETLEIADAEMVEALTRVLRAVQKGQAQPGRVRAGAVAVILGGLALLLFLWVPGAMARYAAAIAPEAMREEVGQRLMEEVTRVAGAPCASPAGLRSLGVLAERLFPEGDTMLAVLPSALAETAHLPGGMIIIGRSIVEDPDTPEALAGYLAAEDLRRAGRDPLERFLRDAGLLTSLRLLSSGHVGDRVLRRHAEALVAASPDPIPDDALIARMAERSVPTAPYAYARDISGETTVRLIEASATIRATEPIIGDGEWIALQTICEG